MIKYLIAYLFVCILSYIIVKGKLRLTHYSGRFDNKELNNTPRKMSLLSMIVVSVIFTLYNVYVTRSTGVLGSDRLNYKANFDGIRTSSSEGLTIIINIIHWLSGDIFALFYFTTFCCLFITLLAYRLSQHASEESLLLLFLSQYILTTFTALKQSYAFSLATLLFTIVLKKDEKPSFILPVLLILLSILFHPSAFVLIPIVIFLKTKKNRYNVIFYIILMLIIGVFFQDIMTNVGQLLQPLLPQLSNKIQSYFGESASVVSESSVFMFVKGLPYYFICFIGLLERPKLMDKIDNYDNYLVISITGSFLYIMTIYNQWLGRFIYFFSLQMFIFFVAIMKNRKSKYLLFEKGVVYIGIGVVTFRFLSLVFTLSNGF